jgi:hypothetical protein
VYRGFEATSGGLSLSFGHRLPGVSGSRLEREELGQVANSSRYPFNLRLIK